MPSPPDHSLLTHWLLENPYPPGGLLILAGLLIGWLGLREGRLDRVRLAAVPLLLGLANLAAGSLVVTAGEHARGTVRELVEAVVSGDTVGAVDAFADDARMHLGSSQNVGRDVDFIRDGIARFMRHYTVEENRITKLRSYTTGGDDATVHLACWTETARLGPSPSEWVLEIRRQEDGDWKVARLTLISVNMRPPPSSW